MTLAPVIALSHGGGPMPLLGDPSHKSIVHSLTKRVPKILHLDDPSRRPKAIILITAHWSTPVPHVTSSQSPELYYDYGGFPPEAYTLKYPAKGDPTLAKEVAEAMRAEGLEVELQKRDWDHGVFVPMKLVRPEADVPIVQVSVLQSEDAEAHFRMGKALRTFREKNVAIVGSGFASFHNFSLMRRLYVGEEIKKKADAFSGAVNDALVRAEDDGGAQGGLLDWRKFPSANDMHPPMGGEHFMPLIVCAGAAATGKDDDVVKSYRDEYSGVDIWTWYWGSGEDAVSYATGGQKEEL